MWRITISVFLITNVHTGSTISENNSNIFKKEQIIFSSEFKITKILVPVDAGSNILPDSTEIPSIFFVVSNPNLEGGSCIYVLEGFAAYEILEGGRDATADYGFDKTIYFGARDGLYKYSSDTLSAKRFGPFRDDIIQLQKVNGSDAIFILTNEHRLYKIERNGTVKTRIKAVPCASEFVLDTSNNVYYLSCDDHMPHIMKSNGRVLTYTASVMEDFKEVKLLRPAFIMEECIPFFGDGYLYILYSNGTSEKKDLFLDEVPSALSVDAALYLAAALNGKIYEINVLEVLIRSLFGLGTGWPRDVTKIFMSTIDTVKGSTNIHGFPKDWKNIIR